MPLRKKKFLPVFPRYIPAFVQSLLNLGKPGFVLAVRDRKFMLTDALTTYFFLTRLNVGFIVI